MRVERISTFAAEAIQASLSEVVRESIREIPGKCEPPLFEEFDYGTTKRCE